MYPPHQTSHPSQIKEHVHFSCSDNRMYIHSTRFFFITKTLKGHQDFLQRDRRARVIWFYCSIDGFVNQSEVKIYLPIKKMQFENMEFIKFSLCLLTVTWLVNNFNGKTSGSVHEHQVLQISWIHNGEDLQPAESCRTGLGYPWSLFWKLHQHLHRKKKSFERFSRELIYISIFTLVKPHIFT